MSTEVILDADVLFKLCLYDLRIWAEDTGFLSATFTTLAASRFVIPKRIRSSSLSRGPAIPLAAFMSAQERVLYVEPGFEELSLAAALEASAQREGLSFDVGESQLLAILLCRGHDLFITGDKRAISALPTLCAIHAEASCVTGRIACLEQLFIRLMRETGAPSLRASVCAEAPADKALAICFCCASQAAHEDQYLAGLVSYVNALRIAVGDVLLSRDEV